MFEKINPSHPDKLADRIAGAIVDVAYVKENDPKIAVEVLLGHKVNVTFQKPYKLTTQYTVSGSITSSRAAQSIYLEICDIIGKKRPNGAVVGGKR